MEGNYDPDRLAVIEAALERLHAKVDVLVADAARVRPLMEKYLSMTKWTALGKGKGRG